MSKIAIVGSRTFENYTIFKSFINQCIEKYDLQIDAIISGGAKGADTLAEKYALENNIIIEVLKPDWKHHGKRAGFIRNEDIINASDEIIAFWDGLSKGTKNDIDLALMQNKNCYIWRFDLNKPHFFVQLELF